MQLLLSGIINCTQLVGVATSLWTMDRFGRRPLLLVGAALMFICHLIIAVLVGKFGGRWADYAVEGWVAVAFLFFYMFSFGATWGPVPWAMPSEIFPSSLRAKGVALSTCSNWFNNFIIVSSHPISNVYDQRLTSTRVLSLHRLYKIPASEPIPFSPSSVCSLSCSHSLSSQKHLAKHWRRWTKSSRMSVARRKSNKKHASCVILWKANETGS